LSDKDIPTEKKTKRRPKT